MELAFGYPVQTQTTALHKRSWRPKSFARLVPTGTPHDRQIQLLSKLWGDTVQYHVIEHMSFDCFLCLWWFKCLSRLILPIEQQTHATFLLVSYPSVTIYYRWKQSGNEHLLEGGKGSDPHTPGSPTTPLPGPRFWGYTNSVFQKGKDNTFRKAQGP